MAKVRIIEHEGERVETGVVQFGDDWPGIFIRGDRAAGIATRLSNIEVSHKMDQAAIDYVIDLLLSCDARKLRKAISDE